MADPPVIEPDEILPPEDERRARPGGAIDSRGVVSSLLAHWLDNILRIPGTGIRFGLDPLIALIPGVGDAAVTGVGATIILAAVRHRAPLRVIVRMAANMVTNTLLNAIPLAGPALSIWFKSNARNNDLLQRHLAGEPPGPPSPQSRLLVIAVLLFVGSIIALNLLIWGFVFSVLMSFLSGA